MELKRKSVKKKQIKVEYIKINNCNCLLFTLEKPFYQIIMGATNTVSFCEIEKIREKVCAIFQNSTREYVYCLEDDIKLQVEKMENDFLGIK